jgi:prepilin-type N-terminal cleavage/methylation domain-containing protein
MWRQVFLKEPANKYMNKFPISNLQSPILVKRGFTLVETLIAVAILMIAIAGPLTIANNALVAALGSRNAMIATYLAQDGMESIKNIKDSNVVSNASDWLSGLYYSTCNTSSGCSTPHAFTISGDTGVSSCNTPTACQLYVNYTDNNKVGYFYGGSVGGGDHLTPFTRTYSLGSLIGDRVVNGVHVYDVTVKVVVSWNDGTIPNAITLQELMTSATR